MQTRRRVTLFLFSWTVRSSIVALGAVLVGGLLAGPLLSQTPSRVRPNIVFAIADDWGWPHAGVYGDQAVRTPTFDRIARDGVLFQFAFVSSPSCTPSRGAIITGQHFWRLQAGANLWANWPDRQFSEYPEMLAAAGYHVGHYRKAWGPGKAEHPPDGRGYQSVDAFFADRKGDQPFCLWFGAFDPHRPYEPGTGKAAGFPIDQVHLFPWFPDNDIVRNDVADYYFEVERFDREVGQLLDRLERQGELANTIVVMTGDHGMPFPRCKGNVYDGGARVPLAICGPQIPGSRKVTDLTSLTDLAPTFLEAAGVAVPQEMTGRSLLPILHSDKSGRVDPGRDFVLLGRERHTIAQEKPIRGGYPVRAIRTDQFLYIRNFEPDRWPAGTPNYERATFRKAWLGDCDNGPTKWELWKNRDTEPVRSQYELCFGKRPAEELYDLEQDPDQIHNVATDPKYEATCRQLGQRLIELLTETGDPRVVGGFDFEDLPYLGGAPQWPGTESR